MHFVDLDESRAKALNLALNRISGDWDERKLASIFADLDESLTSQTGFEADEIDALLKQFKVDETYEGIADLDIEEIDVKEPPQIIWCLIGIPIKMFSDAAPHVAALEELAEVSVQTARNDAG